jgi:hypothetical protein
VNIKLGGDLSKPYTGKLRNVSGVRRLLDESRQRHWWLSRICSVILHEQGIYIMSLTCREPGYQRTDNLGGVAKKKSSMDNLLA